jgi:hypothetical protein
MQLNLNFEADWIGLSRQRTQGVNYSDAGLADDDVPVAYFNAVRRRERKNRVRSKHLTFGWRALAGRLPNLMAYFGEFSREDWGSRGEDWGLIFTFDITDACGCEKKIPEGRCPR